MYGIRVEGEVRLVLVGEQINIVDGGEQGGRTKVIKVSEAVQVRTRRYTGGRPGMVACEGALTRGSSVIRRTR